MKTYRVNSTQALADNIQHFVSELPQQGILYNKVFYRDALPHLIANIKTVDDIQPTDNIDDQNYTSQHSANTQLTEEVSIA